MLERKYRFLWPFVNAQQRALEYRTIQVFSIPYCMDKEVLITIQKAVDSSPELRSKKDLIENFIAGINEVDDVMNEWHSYVAPAVSRFGGGGNRKAKKGTVIEKLKAFFERFWNIG